eukprot:scaffold2306_cov190-Pinguiococcus_pyrenoidosus.AAC.1
MATMETTNSPSTTRCSSRGAATGMARPSRRPSRASLPSPADASRSFVSSTSSRSSKDFDGDLSFWKAL